MGSTFFKIMWAHSGVDEVAGVCLFEEIIVLATEEQVMQLMDGLCLHPEFKFGQLCRSDGYVLKNFPPAKNK